VSDTSNKNNNSNSISTSSIVYPDRPDTIPDT